MGDLDPLVRRRPPSWNLDLDLEADLTSRGELQALLDLIGRSTWWVDPRVARAGNSIASTGRWLGASSPPLTY